MDRTFFDQVILVTGGTGALGSKVSEAFLKLSPRALIITFRSETEMQELREKILHLWQNDDLVKVMGKHAREHAYSRVNFEKHWKFLENIIDHLAFRKN